MRLLRLSLAAAAALLPASFAFVACVGDSSPGADGGDATTGDAASCVAISNQAGTDCFGARCTPETEVCCTGLTGGGLIGSCSDAGCGTPPYLETWSCDKSFDCPAQAPKCCASQQAGDTLFGGLNEGGCPLQLHVAPFDAGGDAMPPPFTIASCQTSCPGFQLCATDGECSGGLKCFPVEFTQSSNSKTFGVCLP